MSEIECFPVSIHIIILKGNSVLMQRRMNTGFADGYLSLPSGKLESDESIIDCTIREAKEELGINIERSNISIIHVLNRKGEDKTRIDYFFKIRSWSGRIENIEKNKCVELGWYDINNLPTDIVPYILYVINMIKDKKPFSVYGWNSEDEKNRRT